MGRQLRELDADLLERQPDALSKDYERNPAEHRPRVAAVTRAFPLGRDEAPLLIETKRGGGYAAAP